MKITTVVNKILRLKEERDKLNKSRIKHFQTFKKELGQEKQLTRELNEQIEELHQFRTNESNM